MTDKKHPFGRTSSDYQSRQAWAQARTVDHRVFERIDYVLSKRGITLKKVSNDLDIPYRSLQNWAASRSTVPTDVVRRLSAYLGIEADYILFGGVDLDQGVLTRCLERAITPLLDLLPDTEIKVSDRLGRSVPVHSGSRDELVSLLANLLRREYLGERAQVRIENPNGYSAPEGGDAARWHNAR